MGDNGTLSPIHTNNGLKPFPATSQTKRKLQRKIRIGERKMQKKLEVVEREISDEQKFNQDR